MKNYFFKRAVLMTLVALFLLFAGTNCFASDKARQTHGQVCADGNIAYPIVYGDTLSGIAWRNRTTVDVLQHLNDIVDPDMIYAGDTLCIPTSTVAAPAVNKQIGASAERSSGNASDGKKDPPQKTAAPTISLIARLIAQQRKASVSLVSEYHRLRVTVGEIHWKLWWFALPTSLLVLVSLCYCYGVKLIEFVAVVVHKIRRWRIKRSPRYWRPRDTPQTAKPAEIHSALIAKSTDGDAPRSSPLLDRDLIGPCLEPVEVIKKRADARPLVIHSATKAS